MEKIQRFETHETEERNKLEDELNYNINNTLSQEGTNRFETLRLNKNKSDQLNMLNSEEEYYRNNIDNDEL